MAHAKCMWSFAISRGRTSSLGLEDEQAQGDLWSFHLDYSFIKGEKYILSSVLFIHKDPSLTVFFFPFFSPFFNCKSSKTCKQVHLLKPAS